MRRNNDWQQQPAEHASVGGDGGESMAIARPSPIPTTIGGSEPLSTGAMSQLLRCRESIRSFDLITARECIEAAVAAHPKSFVLNATHGEVLYRLGLYKEAAAALFTAMLQPPTSWASYQIVSHLYQEARSNSRDSFERVIAPPPRVIAAPIQWLARHGRWLARFRRLEALG